MAKPDSPRSVKTVVIAAIAYSIVACHLLAIVLFLAYLRMRPQWELSLSNTDQGLLIQVYKEGEESPTHQTVVPDHHVKQEVTRATADQLPTDIAKTVFIDDTVKPGRWCLEIDQLRVDIMESYFQINGEEVDR